MAAPTTRIEDKSPLNIYSQHTTASSFPDETRSRLMAPCTHHTCVRCCHCDDFHSATTVQIRHRNSDNGAIGMGSRASDLKHATRRIYAYCSSYVRVGCCMSAARMYFAIEPCDGAEQNSLNAYFVYNEFDNKVLWQRQAFNRTSYISSQPWLSQNNNVNETPKLRTCVYIVCGCGIRMFRWTERQPSFAIILIQILWLVCVVCELQAPFNGRSGVNSTRWRRKKAGDEKIKMFSSNTFLKSQKKHCTAIVNKKDYSECGGEPQSHYFSPSTNDGRESARAWMCGIVYLSHCHRFDGK